MLDRLLLHRCLAMLLASLTCAASFAEAPRVLFLSKSSGYVHSAIKSDAQSPSHVERVLQGIADRHGIDLVSTKDAGRIRTEVLAGLDAVVFYTTGDLTESGDGEGIFGGDSQPPMGANGVAELTAWVEAGGAFLGFHSATDTFADPSGEASPYVRLIGGEFATHGAQFKGALRVVDKAHPTMRHVPQGWTVLDEWYVFKNLAKDRMHVLALLETAKQRLVDEKYDLPDYPIIWCAQVGEGRVFYNGMGHRADVWDRQDFQHAFVDALDWALGKTPLAAAPNFSEVVPGSKY